MLRKVSCAMTLLAVMTTGATAETIVTQFHADLASANVISGGVNISTEPATGTATFVLTQVIGDPTATTLTYDIELNFLDLLGTETPATDDNVTAIHVHNTNLFEDLSPNLGSDTVESQHLLNIFGFPRQDDNDMSFDGVSGIVSGIWDDSDATPGITSTPSFAISSVLAELFNGDVFMMVHTSGFPPGAIGGFIVPEPGSGSMMAAGGLGLFLIAVARRRRQKKSVPARCGA